MSAIVGTYWLDGRPSEHAEIYCMLETMPHRSPDDRRAWCSGPVGLGHGMLRTTAESVGETLPRSNASATATITADARIDNRPSLISKLRLDPASVAIPDSELILRAYERWGTRCVEHLLGDFAFAIWDEGKRHLFCARDHFGVRQLYFHQSPSLFAFGTEIKALFALSTVPEVINERVLAEFFTYKLVDPVETVFEGIVRLPAAHAMVVSAEGCRQWRYWTPEPAKVDQNRSDEEYTDEFLSLLKEAVASRVRSIYPVGAELSGGLDSSFISCLARDQLKTEGRLPLRTVSLVYDRFAGCDERSYIESALSTGGFESHFVHVEEQGILELMDEVYDFLDDGRASGNHHLNWLTARGAGQAGVRVLLTGQDGDSVVSHGWLLFRELAEAHRWEEFAREAELSTRRLQAEREKYHLQEQLATSRDVLNAYGGPVLREWATKKRVLSLFRAIRAIRKHFGVSGGSILKRLRKELLYPAPVHELRQQRRLQHAGEALVPDELNRSLAAKYDLGHRLAALNMREKPVAVREAQKERLGSPYVPATFEKLDHYAAAHGVEVRHPFMDVRLVEYCLGLPARQSFNNGWARAIMRRAMQGVVPDEIRLRAGKSFLGDPYSSLLVDYDEDRAEYLMDRVDGLAAFLDVGRVRELYERRHLQRDDESRRLGRVLSLLLWREKRNHRNALSPRIGVGERPQYSCTLP